MLQWWQVFAHPLRHRLIAESDAPNCAVKIAGLCVIQARARLGIAQAELYPQLQQASVDSLYLSSRQSDETNPQDSPFWQHTGGGGVGWELDFFGCFSRAIEATGASATVVGTALSGKACCSAQRRYHHVVSAPA